MAAVADTDLLATLGQRVRKVRELRGLTQRQLAEQIGRSRGTIANIEAGRQGDIGVTSLFALATALRTTVAELTGTATTTDGSAPWLDLARRVTESERRYSRLAEECWRTHDYLAAVRWRGVAEGLEMAREHHLAVVAEAGGDRRG